VIYLQAKPETLIARVRKRGIDMERRIGDAYLTRLAESYMHFFHNYNAAPVMVVNSENINFVDCDDDFNCSSSASRRCADTANTSTGESKSCPPTLRRAA
jgi:deoxyadenosine/deoxycytidine kinase